MNLKGEVALVTGATRGIGAAIALALARQGAVVVGTATTEAGAGLVEQMLGDAPVPGKGLVLDVGSSDPSMPDSPCSGAASSCPGFWSTMPESCATRCSPGWATNSGRRSSTPI